MLKKTIEYVDYNGNTQKEDFYFNLTKAELTELEVSVDGGLSAMMERIIKEEDHREIVKIFKDFILKAYGVKSEDGRRFIKTQELRDEFSQTEAYSVLFMELATDAEAAAAFINSFAPQ